jgi:hypothetical protein
MLIYTHLSFSTEGTGFLIDCDVRAAQQIRAARAEQQSPKLQQQLSLAFPVRRYAECGQLMDKQPDRCCTLDKENIDMVQGSDALSANQQLFFGMPNGKQLIEQGGDGREDSEDEFLLHAMEAFERCRTPAAPKVLAAEWQHGPPVVAEQTRETQGFCVKEGKGKLSAEAEVERSIQLSDAAPGVLGKVGPWLQSTAHFYHNGTCGGTHESSSTVEAPQSWQQAPSQVADPDPDPAEEAAMVAALDECERALGHGPQDTDGVGDKASAADESCHSYSQHSAHSLVRRGEKTSPGGKGGRAGSRGFGREKGPAAAAVLAGAGGAAASPGAPAGSPGVAAAGGAPQPDADGLRLPFPPPPPVLTGHTSSLPSY